MPRATADEPRAGGQSESERILCALHDTVLQRLEQLAGRCNDPSHRDWDELGAGVRAAAAELRALITDFADPRSREPMLDGVREILCEERRRSEMEIELAYGPNDGSVRGDELEALLGALREGLNNARKHSRSTRATVYFEERDGRAVIRVRDYGIGATPSELRAGFGVAHSILGRMRSAGGWARVEPTDQGLMVTAALGTPESRP